MKKSPLPNTVTLLVLTLILTVFWVALSIYRAFKKVPDVNIPAAILTPLDVSLNMDTLNGIEGRFYLEDSLIPKSQVQINAPIEEEVTPTPVSSVSASLQVQTQEEASQSADLEQP